MHMRLGVLDVGSNTVHLLVVDAHAGAPPVPAFSVQDRAAARRAARRRRPDRPRRRAASWPTFVAEALQQAEDKGVEEMLGVRDLGASATRPTARTCCARVREATGVDLQVLSGEDEARLTFLAVRRWYGWSSGRLLVLDIGGGSLEVATGSDEEPDARELACRWAPAG